MCEEIPSWIYSFSLTISVQVDSKDKEQITKKDAELLKYFTKDELDATAKEIASMEKHLDEYKSYDNMADLKEDLLSDA